MRLNSCTCLFTDSPKGAVRVVHHRDFPLVDAVMDSSGVHADFSHHRVNPDLSVMASPTLVVDPSDTTRRDSSRATYGLYGVAANGLT